MATYHPIARVCLWYMLASGTQYWTSNVYNDTGFWDQFQFASIWVRTQNRPFKEVLSLKLRAAKNHAIELAHWGHRPLHVCRENKAQTFSHIILLKSSCTQGV